MKAMDSGKYELFVECPKCGTQIRPRSVKFTAYGEMEFSFVCPEDGMITVYTWSDVQLRNFAFGWDVETHMKSFGLEPKVLAAAIPVQPSPETARSRKRRGRRQIPQESPYQRR